MNGPLGGIRVVDLADEKGELCGRLLADLGADVVRVEPSGGAISRRLPPFAPDGTSLYFAHRNTNKRSITLDLPREGATLRDMAARADVLVESFPPGYLASAGVSPESLVESGLVVTSITDFGQTGPYSGYAGTDLVCLAMGGAMHHSGTSDRPPLAAPGALAYDAAGVMAAFATLTALRTGRGQHVDLSVMETVSQLGDWSLPNSGGAGSAAGARQGSGVVYPIYPCADGYARIIILSRRQWRSVRDWLGDPEELRDDALDSIAGRLGKIGLIEPFIVELFGRYKKVDLAVEAQRRGISVTPVLSAPEVLASEHYASRGTFVRTEIAPSLTVAAHAGFVELDGERAGPRTPSPSAGEHSPPGWDARPPARTAPGHSPFKGVRVLDFGIGGVGTECARLLAEYGADVIRIESRTYPDFIRLLAANLMSASFASSSRSKRSLGVNVKTAEGLAVVRRLVAISDVIVENSQTGVMDGMGLGYEAVRAINPRIVMISSQLMGSRGDWSAWLGYGPSTRPATGMSWLWNWPGTEDGMPPGSRAIHPDHLVGRICAFAVAAALAGRERTGSGVHVEVSQADAVVGLLGDLYAAESLVPGAAVPRGNVSERGAPWGMYRCAGDERWCAITVRDDDEWQRMVSAMGAPAWAARPDLRTREGRIAAREEIDARVQEWTSQRTDTDTMETLQAAGVPAGRMLYPFDQVSDPHLVARGYPRRIDQPGLRNIVLEGPAFRGSDMPDAITTPAPRLGEHTREICSGLLRMREHEIDALIESGALEVSPS